MLMRKRRVMIKKKRMRKPIEQIDAAGGVLYRFSDDQLEVLLIFRNGVWDLPKGKKDEDETFEKCAVREIREEAGAGKIYLMDYITDTYHEYEMNGKRVGKTTKWYSMKSLESNVNYKPQKEEGITDVQWKPLPVAINEVGYANLVDVLAKFLDLYKKKRTS
jgi:8-oxo-dGTP pyrophosphatase MutT (NUDIX family)